MLTDDIEVLELEMAEPDTVEFPDNNENSIKNEVAMNEKMDLGNEIGLDCKPDLFNEDDVSNEVGAYNNVDENEGISYALLPDVPLLKIFSFLGFRQKMTCSKVCKKWRELLYTPFLWKTVKLYEWIPNQGKVYRTDLDCLTFHDYGLLPKRKLWMLLGDGYVRVVGSMNSVDQATFGEDFPFYREVVCQYRLLVGFLENMLPRVGTGITTLHLCANGGLSDCIFNLYLMLCPNVQYLSARYTSLSHKAFKGLDKSGACRKITHLNLRGCKRLCDATMWHLTECWLRDEKEGKLRKYKKKKLMGSSSSVQVPVSTRTVEDVCESMVTFDNYDSYSLDASQETSDKDDVSLFTYPEPSSSSFKGLKYLNLSGCSKLTDATLTYLSKCKRTADIEFLDVSGCRQFTSAGLRQFVRQCPKLKPDNLFYCSLLYDGPFPDDANGCLTEDEACCFN